MAIILDENFDSLMLDTTNKAYLAENFTYLINKLIDFVDPKIGDHTNYPDIKGGKRRIVRAQRGKQLGYQYKTAASTSTVSSRGTKTIQAFGQNVLVEEWTVSHPHVKDPELGETYPTQDSNGEARGPYTCLITARISLSKKAQTRCYVQCNCKDFDTTFYEELNKAGYTNPKSLPPASGAKALAPAICKHLYAIYSQYYTKLVSDVEGFKIDESPILFGHGDGGPGPEPPPPPPPPVNPVAKTKEEAKILIIARLKQEHNRLKNDKDAYLDSRSRAAAGQRYHLYMFSNVLQNGINRAIAYRNKDKADPKYKNNSSLQLLVIPNNPKIWNFFRKQGDGQWFFDQVRALGPMSNRMNDRIKKETGIEVWSENVEINVTDVSYLIEAKGSSILSSISELS